MFFKLHYLNIKLGKIKLLNMKFVYVIYLRLSHVKLTVVHKIFTINPIDFALLNFLIIGPEFYFLSAYIEWAHVNNSLINLVFYPPSILTSAKFYDKDKHWVVY